MIVKYCLLWQSLIQDISYQRYQMIRYGPPLRYIWLFLKIVYVLFLIIRVSVSNGRPYYIRTFILFYQNPISWPFGYLKSRRGLIKQVFLPGVIRVRRGANYCTQWQTQKVKKYGKYNTSCIYLHQQSIIS